MASLVYRITTFAKRFCLRGLRVCDKYSLRTAFWSLIILGVLAMMFVGASLPGVNTQDALHKLLQREREIGLAKLPVENKPLPVENKPHPVENKPLPVENKPLPVNSKPLPVENKELPVAAKLKPPKPFNPFEVPESIKNRVKPKISETGNQKVEPPKSKKQHYMINWYNAPPYLRLRPDSMNCGFETCKYKNCNLTFERKYTAKSDAVLFDGRWVFEKVGFIRPPGQLWIFAAHEAPITFEDLGAWWKQPQWRHGFNWTMTYDRDNTDIFLPYGELRKHPKPVSRDFKSIAAKKTKGALMINSHCNTSSIRERYVTELNKYFPVDVLGKCGKPWNCGTHYVHDQCFNLLNTTYKFFLAFENAFCNQYFSEKLFENFNFDTIIVTRGGSYKEFKSIFPRGTIISTDDFKTIEGLGKYLGKLAWSLNDYAEMLKQKSQYYSVGYKAVYQRALCDVCERMNNLDKYKKIIPDIVDWAYSKNPCRGPTDLK